jgi:hypothetical protein
VPLVGGDHGRLTGHRCDLLRIEVVAALEHDAAQVLEAHLLVDRRGQVLALESEQEELGHLALERKPRREVRDRRGSGRPVDALGRRRDQPGEKRAPLARARAAAGSLGDVRLRLHSGVVGAEVLNRCGDAEAGDHGECGGAEGGDLKPGQH